MPRKNRKGRKSEKGKQVATAKPVLKIAEDVEIQPSRGETLRHGGYRHSWDSPMAGYCYTVYR